MEILFKVVWMESNFCGVGLNKVIGKFWVENGKISGGEWEHFG